MIINLRELTALLPVLILITGLVVLIFSISCNRNHFLVAVLSTFFLIITLFSLYFLISIVPINITILFYLDRYSLFYIAIILLSSISTCVFSYSWLLNYPFNKEEFYLLLLLSTLGSICLTISNNMSSIFISIELMSLPIFGLIAYSNYVNYSLEASFKYLILSAISSSFLLLGISWIYAISGDLSIFLINHALLVAPHYEKLVLLFGIVMVLFSFLFKLSLVPFHLWTSDVYQGTPSSILSFFSVSGKVALFSVLLNMFSYSFIEHNAILYEILLLISIFSIFFGNLMAIFQKNIKRFFGYSSISQLGYLLIILLVLKNNYIFSLETVLIYLLNYLFINIAYFGIIHLFSCSHNDIDLINFYRGLFWSEPTLSFIMTIVLLSLAGIPITLGFIGKFYILSIIIKNHLWLVGISFLFGTILGIYGYFRLIINLYLKPSNQLLIDNKVSYNIGINIPSKILILCSGIMLLIFGLFPNLLIYFLGSTKIVCI
ncbi:NADH-quinone oxidoreductase subunit N [Buchnera aphidicola (Aphis glycines)]|uniref:NADH-quinone oxidoreductase subunit N n=1 Tax=Buchnera aphidicola (Aphis glycines) TaxID=1265350 RepID=A0A0M4HV38_9GAMM|nr:NADH-quinone oxidoreductase subunit N [Buchnera aphidicola]ALD15129.1 NADH-quinone oxidoreductase subunit N [Buchnera aphidicola (Aphis glycines)]